MKRPPFFSVLIPTKNRSHLVGYAIQSVLDQTFDEFEIIVVDNDDSKDTYEAVKQFDDPRIRYFQTGGLNMSENWEFSLEQASGRYITVLEDKQAYYSFALQSIHDRIQADNANVVVWSWDLYDDNRKCVVLTHSHSASSDIISSDEIINKYVTTPKQSWGRLPRMINAVASREIIMQIKDASGGERFFSEFSPDLCAAFQLLACVDRVSVINRSVGLVGYMNLSNANRIKKEKGSVSFYGRGNVELKSVEFVPIKKYWLIHNTVYNDFLRIRTRMGGRLQRYQMSNEVYAKLCINDMASKPFNDLFNFQDWKDVLAFVRNSRISLLSCLVEFLRCIARRMLSRHLDHIRGAVVRISCDNILQAAHHDSLSGAHPG